MEKKSKKYIRNKKEEDYDISFYLNKLNLTDSSNKNKELNKNSIENSLTPIKNYNYKRSLCIDILNFSDIFIDFKDMWNIQKASNKIKKFVNLCRNQNYEPEIFIDGPQITSEAQNKWKKRRENDILSERIKPQCLNTIISDLFKQYGVNVYYSLEFDNDDTIAAFAHNKEGFVLSGDRDFLRYIDFKYIIYKDFYIQGNEIIFINQDKKKPKLGVSYSKIYEGFPKTGKNWKDLFITEISNGIYRYRRGSVSPFVKYFGNPHNKIKDLRIAFFKRIGIRGKITEIFPDWDLKNNQVYWYEKEILLDNQIDEYYDKLLYDPDEAVKILYGEEYFKNNINCNYNLWKNHIYCSIVIIYELCSVVMKVPIINLIINSCFNKKSW